jgi:uncharacterized membrane protein YciS (DUF1049 family)
VTLFLLFVLALVTLVLVVFLLGFRLGGEHWQAELTRVRLEAARAERQVHDLTRQAFVAMAERVEQVRRHNR